MFGKKLHPVLAMSTFVLPMASVAPPMFGKKLHPVLAVLVMSTFVLPMASVAPPMSGTKLHAPNLNSEVLLLLLPRSLLPPMAGNTCVLPEPPMFGPKLTSSSNPKLNDVFGDCGCGLAVRRPRFWAFPPLPSRPSTCFRLPPIMSVAFMPMPPMAGKNDAMAETLPPVAAAGLSDGNQYIVSTMCPPL